MITVKGFVCQRCYVTIISRLLKVKGRGLPNKELAYRLWRDLEAAPGLKLDSASMRTGEWTGYIYVMESINYK